jgi:hypothetical protein
MTISEIEDITNLTKHKIRHIINRNNLEYLGRNKYNSELHRKLLNILKVVFPDNKFVEEYYIKDTKQHIDIFDTTLNVAYEANGIQHYISKGTWNRNPEDFSKQQYRDFIKKEWCLKNNIPLIIIRYDEDLTSDLIISKLEKVLPKGGVAL